MNIGKDVALRGSDDAGMETWHDKLGRAAQDIVKEMLNGYRYGIFIPYL